MIEAPQITSFPDTYKIYSLNQLLEAYIQGPERIRRSIDGLSESELKQRVRGPKKWSIYETVIHIVDSELMGAARFKQTLAQSGKDFAYYNQDIWLEKFRYNMFSNERFEKMLELFDLLRWIVYQHLQNVSEEDWSLTGKHQELGEVTLRNLLELYADHSERHLAQINESRELLGKGVIVPLLLKVRLY